jgi:osmotically-inducible protein OsmY
MRTRYDVERELRSDSDRRRRDDRDARNSAYGYGDDRYDDEAERGGTRRSMGFLGDDQRGAYGRERHEPGPRAWYGSADAYDAQRGRGEQYYGGGSGRQYGGYGDDVTRAYGGPGQQYGGHGRYDDVRPRRPAYRSETVDAYGRTVGDDAYGHRGRGPKNYTRSDERIREDVCERLADDNAIDARDIDVDVRGGIVTLTGSVDARHLKLRAEYVADHCAGVEDVQNQLSVKTRATPASRDDTNR